MALKIKKVIHSFYSHCKSPHSFILKRHRWASFSFFLFYCFSPNLRDLLRTPSRSSFIFYFLLCYSIIITYFFIHYRSCMRSFSVSVVTVHPSLAPAIVPLLLARLDPCFLFQYLASQRDPNLIIQNQLLKR